MNKPKYPMFILVGALVIAALFVFNILYITTRANLPGGSVIVGMGDLRRLEAQQVKQNFSKLPGMGDLRRFEGLQVEQDIPASDSSSNKPVGMGDLRRYEALQTSYSVTASFGRECPSMSTPAGERDAGASAPAEVLQAQGCLVEADN